MAKKNGLSNISIDLIYGFPLLSDEKWKYNLDKALSLGVQHISSYSMTVEQGTALSKLIEKGKLSNVNDEQSTHHFQTLCTTLHKEGFEQYEISNFCLPGFESKHNSSYWLQKKYLGIGPGAHSYNGKERFWNVSNNMKYILSLETNQLAYEAEIIDEKTAYNEYVLTRLRTKWGIEKKTIHSFSTAIQEIFFNSIKQFLESKKVLFQNDSYILSEEGKLLADGIASELFVIQE